jgi:uncharacterized membrane protein YfcA
MDISALIAIAVVLMLGSALQSAAGFGFGMFAIPLLILLGSESYEAIAIIGICSTAQALAGLWTLRRDVSWVLVAVLVAIIATTLPVGVWVLDKVASLEAARVGQVFGAIVLTALLAQWLWRIRPRDHLHWGWAAGAGIVSGFMSGLAGMGGPPLVMWVMAHRWTNQRSRATLWAMIAGLTPFQMLFLYLRFGDDVVGAMGEGVLLAPLTLLGLLPGLWIGHRIPKPVLRQLSYVILLLISLYAILQPVAAALLAR